MTKSFRAASDGALPERAGQAFIPSTREVLRDALQDAPCCLDCWYVIEEVTVEPVPCLDEEEDDKNQAP